MQALAELHNSYTNKDASVQDKERKDLLLTLEKGAELIEKKFRQSKLTLIKLYAVPNTKEDLLEILSMAASAAYDNDGVIGDEEEVWLQKTDQIYQKLLVLASDDPTTINQATRMIASLIKRLPQKYKQFTRIPKEQYDNISQELKLQAEERKIAIRKKTLSYVLGWRGIVMLLFCIPIFYLCRMMISDIMTFRTIRAEMAIISIVLSIPSVFGVIKMYIKCAKKAEEAINKETLF